MITDAGLSPQPGQFLCLRDTDVAVEEGVAQLVDGVQGGGETSQPCGVADRTIDLRPHPMLHRAMAVDGVDPTALTFMDDGRHFGFGVPPLQLERPEPIGQFVVGDVDQLLNQRREHEADAIELLRDSQHLIRNCVRPL